MRDDDRRRLVEVTEAGRVQTPVAARAKVRDGIDVSWEVPGEPLNMVEINGDLFARLDRREEVPWRSVLGIGPTDSYRVRITDGVHSLMFACDSGRTLLPSPSMRKSTNA